MSSKDEQSIRDGRNLSENTSEFSIALDRVANGEVDAGLTNIRAIRDRILARGDEKSKRWLLPQVEVAIDGIEKLKEWCWEMTSAVQVAK